MKESRISCHRNFKFQKVQSPFIISDVLHWEKIFIIHEISKNNTYLMKNEKFWKILRKSAPKLFDTQGLKNWTYFPRIICTSRIFILQGRNVAQEKREISSMYLWNVKNIFSECSFYQLTEHFPQFRLRLALFCLFIVLL